MTLLSFLCTLPLTAAAATSFKFVWATTTPMPEQRSDMTATKIGNKVYLAGGCSAHQVRAPWDNATYYCPEITSACSVFDLVANTYTPCAALPAARYRHTAAAVDGKVWLVGGRDINDAIIQEIHVFDPAVGTWSIAANWTTATSDLASLSVNGSLFLIGGYNADYSEAVATFVKVDPIATLAASSVVSTPMASLLTGRGDIFAAEAGGFGMVSGGFSHQDWCAALTSVDIYDFAADTWTNGPALGVGRGDKALVELGGRLYAIGGEHNDGCSQVSGNSIPVDDVEVLDLETKEWKFDTSLPEELFRFVAVPVEDQNTIYIFGGQKYYNETCDCFAVSDHVLKLQITSVDISVATPGAFVSPSSLALLFLGVAALL